MVDNILEIIYGIVELTNILLCYELILQAEWIKGKRRLCIVYSGIMLCNAINIFCGLGIDKSAVNTLYCWLMPLCLIKGEKKKWLILYPCAYLMSSIVNITGVYFNAIIFEMAYEDITNSNLLSLCANTFFTVIAGIAFLYTRKKQKKNKLKFSKMIYGTITVGSLSFIFIIGIVQYLGMNYQIPNNQINILVFLLALMCVIFCLMFLWISISAQRREQDKKEKEMLNLYISDQKKQIELIVEKDSDMRKFRHDIRGHMWVISQCIEKSDYKTVKEFIERIFKIVGKEEVENYTEVVALDAVISDKKRMMDEKDIKFVWEKKGKEIPKHIETYDICTVLINILNNAIEAVEKLDKNDREIHLRLKADDGKLCIMSRNKMIGEVKFDDEQNPITTKTDKKNHGLGGKNIREVANRYNGVLTYAVENQYFFVKIII